MVPSGTSSSCTSSDSSITYMESSSSSDDSEFEIDNASANEMSSSSLLMQKVAEGKPTLLESLGKWAARSQTVHTHVNSLLKILMPFHPELPSDARTLLGSAGNSASFAAMGSGEYCRHKRRCEFQELVDQKKKRSLEQGLYSPDVSDSHLNPSSETVAVTLFCLCL
ncbi:hypothetical protein SprV_0501770800 [Sparganum proliferum]